MGSTYGRKLMFRIPWWLLEIEVITDGCGLRLRQPANPEVHCDQHQQGLSALFAALSCLQILGYRSLLLLFLEPLEVGRVRPEPRCAPTPSRERPFSLLPYLSTAVCLGPQTPDEMYFGCRGLAARRQPY
jgi:hypothetical protein